MFKKYYIMYLFKEVVLSIKKTKIYVQSQKKLGSINVQCSRNPLYHVVSSFSLPSSILFFEDLSHAWPSIGGEKRTYLIEMVYDKNVHNKII